MKTFGLSALPAVPHLWAPISSGLKLQFEINSMIFGNCCLPRALLTAMKLRANNLIKLNNDNALKTKISLDDAIKRG